MPGRWSREGVKGQYIDVVIVRQKSQDLLHCYAVGTACTQMLSHSRLSDVSVLRFKVSVFLQNATGILACSPSTAFYHQRLWGTSAHGLTASQPTSLPRPACTTQATPLESAFPSSGCCTAGALETAGNRDTEGLKQIAGPGFAGQPRSPQGCRPSSAAAILKAQDEKAQTPLSN